MTSRENICGKTRTSGEDSDSGAPQDNDDEPSPLPNPENNRFKKYKIGKSICLCLVSMSMGMTNNATASSLLSLSLRVGADMEQIGRATAAKPAGVIIGAIFGGILSDRLRMRLDLIIVAALLLNAVTGALKPWTGSLSMLGLLFFGEGASMSCLNCAANLAILMLWGESTASPVHALHFGFGIGITLVPLMIRPFLPERYLHLNITNSTENNVSGFPAIIKDHDTSTIEIPYAIVGLITLTVSIVFIFYYMIGPPNGLKVHGETKNSLKKVLHPGSCGGETIFTIQLLFFLCLFYLVKSAKDGSMFGFIFAYAVKGDHHMSNRRAASLDVAFGFAYMCGRAISIFTSHWCKIQILLGVQVALCAASVTGLCFLGFHMEVFLWIFSMAFSIFAAPLYPGGIAWGNQYVTVSAVVVSLLDIFGGLMGIFISWFAGYLFEYLSPRGPLYICLVSSVTLCLLFAFMQTFASCHVQKHNTAPRSDGKGSNVKYMKLKKMSG